MKKVFCVLVLACCLCLSCGDDDTGGETPIPVSVPTGLTASGSLGEIRLQWTAATGDGLTGYRIYRSTDGIAFTQVAEPSVTVWTDTIASPAGDGVLYSYRITAVGTNGESLPSASVRTMHGIRLSGTHTGGTFTLSNTSPFVIEDTFQCQSSLTIGMDQQLYVLPGAILMFTNDALLQVNGILRVLGTPAAPAILSATRTGGLGDGEGFRLLVNSTASGVRFEHAIVTNLQQDESLTFATSAVLSNSKFYSTRANGESSVTFSKWGIQAPTVSRCFFFRFSPVIGNDLIGTTFSFIGNRLRGGYYTINAGGYATLLLDPGMVSGNDFDASGSRVAFLWTMTGSGTIPVGGNYWFGGTNTPPVPQVLFDSSPDTVFGFTPALAAPPADCGPTW